MTKNELRKIYKSKRTAITAKEKLIQDDLLLLQFQRFPYGGISTLLTYWPLVGQMEPNTHLFSSFLRHMIPGLQIAYPVTDSTVNTLHACTIDEDTVYEPRLWGLTEPKAGKVMASEKIDMIFVPMLICDISGFRVGYGKGFYDRFLATCRPDVIKIGFSYFEPIAAITDTHQFDVPLNYCITPKDVYEF